MDPLTQRIWMPGGESFTDACWFMNAESNSTAAAIGTLDLYNSSPTETAWEVPPGVTSVSIAVMGCGGGGQQYGSGAAKPVAVGGGEMMWVNNVSVTPGQTLYVHAGCGYSRNGNTLSYDGTSADVAKYISDTSGTKTNYTNAAVTDYSRASYVRAWVSGHKWIAYAAGGNLNEFDGGNNAGAYATDSTNKYATLSNEGTDWRHEQGGDGGGISNEANWWLNRPRGSGGAAGYTGSGGDGANSTGGDGNAGSGGGGGGGSSGPMQGNNHDQSRGGNTFMWGAGDNGIAGDYTSNDSSYKEESDGGDGSKTGTGATNNPPDGLGEGGGGGSEGWSLYNGHVPQYDGWVRIVWGAGRTFPSTNVAYPG
tara:strand:+ start:2795 stop:3892 length:1098 start_codon:yes stop_codon:yes gene_type:complete